jgi:hypothetical protein
MLIYDVATVIDCGTYWRVTNVSKSNMDALSNPNENKLKLSSIAYDLIRNLLEQGKEVKIKKPLFTNEVLPGEIFIDEVEDLQLQKNSSIIKIRMLVTPELSKISGFSLYGFMMLNNDLSSKGYFITDENREEKYLEILETNDESLIQKLEDYLNYRDEIDKLASLERMFSKFKSDVNESSTIEEVKKFEEIFLEKFYNNF